MQSSLFLTVLPLAALWLHFALHTIDQNAVLLFWLFFLVCFFLLLFFLFSLLGNCFFLGLQFEPENFRDKFFPFEVGFEVGVALAK